VLPKNDVVSGPTDKPLRVFRWRASGDTLRGRWLGWTPGPREGSYLGFIEGSHYLWQVPLLYGLDRQLEGVPLESWVTVRYRRGQFSVKVTAQGSVICGQNPCRAQYASHLPACPKCGRPNPRQGGAR